MLFNLLTDTTESTGSPWGMYIMLGAIAVIFVVMMVYSRRSQTKRQQETLEMLNAIKPGNKVKTIGGICGVVVEICKEDNTFVLETGTEASGKSYIKFDMQAIYMSDALATQEAPVEAGEEAPVAEEPVFEEGDAPVAEASEEKPADEE